MAHNLDLDGNIVMDDKIYKKLQREELDKLRRQQARKVMPKIGPMLDAWELLCNDIKSDPGFKRLDSAIAKIYTAMVGNSE